MHIYLKNNPVEFHLDPIGNDGAEGFFETKNKKNKKKMSSDMRSVPDIVI